MIVFTLSFKVERVLSSVLFKTEIKQERKNREKATKKKKRCCLSNIIKIIKVVINALG